MKTNIHITNMIFVLIVLILTISDINQLSAQCTIPVVDPIANQTYNPGDVVPTITLTSNIPGANFRWSRTSEPGIHNFGNGIPSFTATNSSCSVPFTDTYTVSAFLGNVSSVLDECYSPPVQFTITVNPKPIPVVDPLPNLTYNNGDVVPAITLTSDIPGANFRWSRTSEPGIHNFGNGIPSFTATNSSCSVPFTDTYTVSAFLGNVSSVLDECYSAPVQFTITVIDNQPPVLTCPPNKTAITAVGVCYATASAVNAGTATATDNCGATVVGVRSDGQSLSANYPGGITTITWTATDPSNNTSTCTQIITVTDNQPPVITGESASTHVLSPPNHIMRDVTVNYTSTDNCGGESCSLIVTSNEPVNGTADGDTDPDWEVVDDHHVKLRAERAANGSGRIYTITVTCIDHQGNASTKTVEVKVAHNITGPLTGKPFKVGSTVDFAGDFWDKPTNKHTAKWLIDDNTTVKGVVTEPTSTKNGKVTGSYKFTSSGVYKLQMNTIDQNNVTTYANTNGDVEEIIVIYDPNGGYAYGGGYFNSPAGALKSNPTATGKVSYGFVMNYFKNATLPKGETQFEFKIGDFEYNAVNFDYLSISGAKAQFKGTGKIVGGQSGINFIMTVIDGDLDGTGIDKVRMKIYNKNTGQVYYDNQPGASDAANPTIAVGLNSSIVVQNTNITSTQKQIITEEVRPMVKELEVKAAPNPTNNSFTIYVNSNNLKDRIVMHVIDLYGRVIEIRNVASEQTIKLGDKYKAGTYIVRLLQGDKQKELKLIKL